MPSREILIRWAILSIGKRLTEVVSGLAQIGVGMVGAFSHGSSSGPTKSSRVRLGVIMDLKGLIHFRF